MVAGEPTIPIDNKLFLQHLRDLPLEEGKAYIQEHIEELADHAAIGELLAGEAALVSLDIAGEEFLSLGEKGNWARSRISWVSSEEYLGRSEDALQATEQACIVFSQLGELYWVGVLKNNAAVVYEFIGRYQDAIKLHEQMLAIFSPVTD